MRLITLTLLLLLPIATRADQFVLVDERTGQSLAVDTRSGAWCYFDGANTSQGSGGKLTRPTAGQVIFERKLTSTQAGIRASFNTHTGRGQALIVASGKSGQLAGLWLVAESGAPIPTPERRIKK